MHSVMNTQGDRHITADLITECRPALQTDIYGGAGKNRSVNKADQFINIHRFTQQTKDAASTADKRGAQLIL